MYCRTFCSFRADFPEKAIIMQINFYLCGIMQETKFSCIVQHSKIDFHATQLVAILIYNIRSLL